MINSFDDHYGNTYNLKITLSNFLKYDKFSDTYKKMLVFLYLGTQDEMSARLHEFFHKAKINFKKSYKEIEVFNMYKEMINFKIDVNKLTESEKKKISYHLTKNNIKKLEKYINMQGKKFIRKIQKLSYFQET